MPLGSPADALFPRPQHCAFEGSWAAGPVRVQRRVEPALPQQGYRLRVSPAGDVEIDAADAAGLRYAAQTLDQLAGLQPGQLPVGEVHDWPDLPVRGVMLDVSRGRVPTLPALQELVDRLSSWRVTQFHLAFQHTFAFSGHSAVWEPTSPVTAAELRALFLYCQERGVELVAHQTSLAHFERWLAHPAYRPLAAVPPTEERPYPSTLDPQSPAAFQLVADLLAELVEVCPSQTVHIGCDEPFDLPEDQLPAYRSWVDRVLALPALDGRTVQIWSDVLRFRAPLMASPMPGNVVVCDWGYEADYDFGPPLAFFHERGTRTITCPGTAAWSSLSGRSSMMQHNIRRAVEQAKDGPTTAGVLLTDWGDMGHLNPPALSETGFAYAAGQAWCSSRNDIAAAARAVDTAFGLTGLGEATLALGEVAHVFDPQYSFLAPHAVHLYFPQAVLGEMLSTALTAANVANGLDLLGEVDGQLASLAAHRGAAWATEDLAVAADLTRLALRDAEQRVQVGGALPPVPTPARRVLEQQLEDVRARSEAAWLARSRPGGLYESHARLDHLAHCYRSGTVDEQWGGPAVPPGTLRRPLWIPPNLFG